MVFGNWSYITHCPLRAVRCPSSCPMLRLLPPACAFAPTIFLRLCVVLFVPTRFASQLKFEVNSIFFRNQSHFQRWVEKEEEKQRYVGF